MLTLATGLLAVSPLDVTNTFAVDRYYRTPYAQTWNITIQHDLGKGFFMEVGYLGTKGTRLDVLTLPNEGPPGTAANRNQLGNATGFTYDSSVGDSIYHALQTRLMRRFRGGISMNALYTFRSPSTMPPASAAPAARSRRTGSIWRPSAASPASIAATRST